MSTSEGRMRYSRSTGICFLIAALLVGGLFGHTPNRLRKCPYHDR
jgi:hypothetical protein